ncbi:MAG: SDR family oxidoreductase [Candidatus Izemoplasmatales bacterium]|jgi:hypothetical protein
MNALVTGASSGIGKAIAEELAKKKINLFLVARRQAELDEIKVSLESRYGIKVFVKTFDLSTEANCFALFEACKNDQLEIVINNAGFGCIGLFENIELDTELKMLRLNIMSVHILTKLFVRSMKQGVILNVASMAGFIPTPNMAAYAASKAYVYNFSEAINHELKRTKKKVRVLSLCPGPVNTNFANVAGAKTEFKGMSAEKCARIAVRGIERHRHHIIPGLGMKLIKFFVRFLPLGIILPMAFMIQSKKDEIS